MQIPTSVIRFGQKAGNWLVKNGPNIMRISGGVMAVGGAVMACKATLHAEEVLDAHKERMAQIEAARALSEENGDLVYTDKMMKRDKTIAYLETAVGFGKLYGPAFAVGMGGIGLMQGAWCITENRRSTAVAALTSVDRLFSEYRARVEDVAGPEVAAATNDIPTEKHSVPEIAEEPVDCVVLDDSHNDPFFFIFDKTNPNWYNNAFLLNERFAMTTLDANNYKLSAHSVTHTFINDILKDFGGLKRLDGTYVEGIPEGQFYGWNAGTGDIIEYDIIPYLEVFDEDDDKQMPMLVETDREAIRELEMNDIQDGYCFGIRLKSSSDGYPDIIPPRMIYHEVYGA